VWYTRPALTARLPWQLLTPTAVSCNYSSSQTWLSCSGFGIQVRVDRNHLLEDGIGFEPPERLALARHARGGLYQPLTMLRATKRTASVRPRILAVRSQSPTATTAWARCCRSEEALSTHSATPHANSIPRVGFMIIGPGTTTREGRFLSEDPKVQN
jgi:hypothetical protein